MQFFWKYIDDLMGKGINVATIIELLFYVSASLIPLALPLAILLSSIMTLGNLAEHNELTALKSSGLSLYRVLRPLTFCILVIAVCTFFFANYIIPVSNLKWHSIIFDIQNTKISTIVTPGAYSNSLDGYSIKVDEGDNNYVKGILIHDKTSPKEIKTIRAKDGKIYKSDNGKYVFFELHDGTVMEELDPAPPIYGNQGIIHNAQNSRPTRRSSFDQATYKIDLSGFDMKASQENLFRDKHEMMNVFQINYTLDSLIKNRDDVLNNFLISLKNDHPYYQALNYQANSTNIEDGIDLEILAPDTMYNFSKLSVEDKIRSIGNAQSSLRKKIKNLEGQETFANSLQSDMDRYLLEFHRKFALTVAIIVLFFVGAPLGAIVKKGGFGAPVVIAALLFMIYFVLMTIGENMAFSKTISPFLGMWFPTFVLAPIALWLMRAAANDAPVFNISFLHKLIFWKK